MRRRGLLLVLSVVACRDIVPNPINKAPMNACPCDGYESTGRTNPTCRQGRCEIPTVENRPDFPFWIVVHVPESSVFAAGMTYVMYSDRQGEPAFKARPNSPARCALPSRCLIIGDIASARGTYTVTREASTEVGYPLNDGASIPVRAVFLTTGNDQKTQFEAKLPVDTLFAASELVDVNIDDPTLGKYAEYRRALPFGRYQRVLFPLPPFDEFFPPTVDAQRIASGNFIDGFQLGGSAPTGKPLDDINVRTATVTNESGLDGMRIWLQDQPTQRRISTIRTLKGREMTVRLDTTGEKRTPTGGLGDDVEVVIAPPPTWTAIPRYVSPLFGGAGLGALRYPALPPPVAVTGVVTLPAEGETLKGYPAEVSFESDQLLTQTAPDSLLHYSTSVSTDEFGRFATVMPPGTYRATVEPALNTGRAMLKQAVVVDQTVTALRLQPPALTVVRGRVFLADDRPLRDAEVMAQPEPPANSELMARPRPGRATTQPDGRFTMELDPGSYVFTVAPRAGTGFPRVVTRKEIPATETDLEDIRVPVPTRLSFEVRDPSLIGNPIERAIVRIFAAVPGRESTPVEIGSAITDANGAVEILLAPEPR